jgi:hypothetical protein
MQNVSDGSTTVNAGTEPPVKVVVNNIAPPPAFVGAHNAEAIVGLPPRPFRAALKASKLPVTRVRGLGPVVERQAFITWLAGQARRTMPASIAPRDEADKALEAAGFVRRAAL